MPQSVYSTPCVAFQNAIYVIDSNVYEYVPKVDMWRTMPIKQFFRGFSCAMADDEYIYLVGKYDGGFIFSFQNFEKRDCIVSETKYTWRWETCGLNIGL